MGQSNRVYLATNRSCDISFLVQEGFERIQRASGGDASHLPSWRNQVHAFPAAFVRCASLRACADGMCRPCSNATVTHELADSLAFACSLQPGDVGGLAADHRPGGRPAIAAAATAGAGAAAAAIARWDGAAGAARAAGAAAARGRAAEYWRPDPGTVHVSLRFLRCCDKRQ